MTKDDNENGNMQNQIPDKIAIIFIYTTNVTKVQNLW